jgi:hypothetical protein
MAMHAAALNMNGQLYEKTQALQIEGEVAPKFQMDKPHLIKAECEKIGGKRHSSLPL